MKRVLGLLLIGLIVTATGCNQMQHRKSATMQGPGAEQRLGPVSSDYIPPLNPGWHAAQGQMPMQGMHSGPQTAATAYPYYTTRAPRDFLAPNPPKIGY